MKNLLFCVFMVFTAFFANANEKISKLNQLFLNGVLDKSSYLNSLEGMGINTSNEIFTNLFELFSDNTLDLSSYEKSLNNLMSMSSQNRSVSETVAPKTEQINDNQRIKKYKLDNCRGDSKLCKQLKEFEFPFFVEDKKVVLDKETIQLIIDSDHALHRVMQIKNFLNNDTFTHKVQVTHVNGIFIDLNFSGYLEGGDFFVNKLSLIANGKEMLSSNLETI